MSRFETVLLTRIIHDKETDLLWHPDTIEGNYSEALQFPKSITNLELTWRLPTIEELNSIVDRKLWKPASNLTGILPSGYWSSTEYAGDKFYDDKQDKFGIWIVNMSDGYISYYITASKIFKIRCVSNYK